MSYREAPKTIIRQSTFINQLIQFHSKRINNIYSFPSNITNAKIHQIASTFGYKSTSTNAKTQICPCCSEAINTQELPMYLDTTPDLRTDNKTSSKQQFKLSTGISLFFSFIKMIIMYLIMKLLISDIFNLISSATMGTFCNNNPKLCTSTFISQLSSYNKIDKQYLVYTLDILNLISVIISIVYFNFYRKIQYKIENIINSSQHTQDDYSLFVQNIPIILIDHDQDIRNLQFNYQDKLKQFFDDKLTKWLQTDIKNDDPSNSQRIQRQFIETIKGFNPTQLKKVSGITLCFDLTEMKKLKNMRNDLMQQYSALAKQTQTQTNSLVEEGPSFKKEIVDLKIKLINQQIIILCKDMAENNSMSFNLTHFVGKAYISFEYQHFRDYILRQYSNNKQFLKINNDQKHLKVSLSSPPNDVIWQNMKITDNERFKKITISYLILFMVLTFAFGGVLLINRLKSTIHKNNPQAEKFNMFLTILMTVLILVINTGLAMIVKKLTISEKHQSKSKYLMSMIIKTLITQFLNTSIIYYITDLIYPTPLLIEEGLVFQVSSLFLTSAFIQIIMNFAYISSLVKKIEYFLFYKNKTQHQMFQIELNQKLQSAEFEISQRYSYYLLQVFTAAFYSYITPIATFSLVLAFIAQYWIDKFNLFKRSCCKFQMDFDMSRYIFKIFQSSLLIFTIGNLIFSVYLHSNQTYTLNKVNIAAFIIAFAYFCFIWLAPNHIFIKIFAFYEQIESISYSQCIKNKYFKQTYWKTNPGTMYIKEIDINTKEEVKIDNLGDFANAEDLKNAVQNLNNYLNQDENDNKNSVAIQGIQII